MLFLEERNYCIPFKREIILTSKIANTKQLIALIKGN